MHEIGRFSTTVLSAIYIYNKFIYFISILLARIIVVLNLPISCTEILNTTNSISLISYWSSIIFVHKISRFSTTMIVAIYIYNKFIYFISILLARIIVVLNLPISCTEILNTINSISGQKVCSKKNLALKSDPGYSLKIFWKKKNILSQII